MAFPTSPTVGQTHTVGKKVYKWNGTAWDANALTNDVITINAPDIASFFDGANDLLAENGYQKLPNGFILQWVTTASQSTNTNVNITFPMAFPNACLNAWATAGTILATNESKSFSVTSLTTTGCVSRHYSSTGAGSIHRVFAIGY